MEIVKIYGIFIYFSCRISKNNFIYIILKGDHKTFYWTRGIIENFMLILKKLLEKINKVDYNISNNNEEEKLIESITFAIYKLSLDSGKYYSKT